MPTQTTDLFLLEDLEETRSKREPLVRARPNENLSFGRGELQLAEVVPRW